MNSFFVNLKEVKHVFVRNSNFSHILISKCTFLNSSLISLIDRDRGNINLEMSLVIHESTIQNVLSLGNNLIRSTIAYTLIALAVIIAFNYIAGEVLRNEKFFENNNRL